MSVSDQTWEDELLKYLHSLREGERDLNRAPPTPEGGMIEVVRRQPANLVETRPAVVRDHRTGIGVVKRPAGSESPIVRDHRTNGTVTPISTTLKPGVVRGKTLPGLSKRYDWTVSPDLPSYSIMPVPVRSLEGPIRVEDFLVWADRATRRVIYALAEPRLTDFHLTVYRERVAAGSGTTIKTTGGSAVLELAAYADYNLQELQWRYALWLEELDQGQLHQRPWSFERLDLSNLEVKLDLPQGYLKAPPNISASATSGRATILLDLSELGAQAWQGAIEERRPGAMAGACELKAHYYGQLDGRLRADTHVLSAPLGTLAESARVGRGSLRVIRPEVSVEAKMVVIGDEMLERVALSLTPSGGHEPVSHVFDAAGGTYSLALTSDRPEELELDWTALVHFKPAGWPVIRTSGKMGDNQWAEMIKPDAWMQPFTLVVMLFDERGDVIPAGSDDDVDPNNRVYGEVTFTAPYLDGAPLRAGFDSSSQQMVHMQFPVPPGVTPGEVKLTVMTQRGGSVNMKTRILRSDETATMVSVKHDAEIEIQTNRDPSPDSSFSGQVHDVISRLQPPKPPVGPRVETGGPDILGPAFHPVRGDSPVFEVDPRPNRYYVVEVTTDASLFDYANSERRIADTNFYASDWDEPFLSAPTYRLPQNIWQSLRREGRLYYRLYTSADPDEWVDWDVTTPDVAWYEAPFVEMTPSTGSTADLDALLRYLGIGYDEFAPWEPDYFRRLSELLRMHGTLGATDLVNASTFREAVRDFQRGAGLGADGIPGEDTLWALQVAWANERRLDIQRVDADTWVRPGLGAHDPDRDGYDRFRLRQDIVHRYFDLHDEVIAAGGLLTSSGSLRELNAALTPGRSALSMHYSGLALDLALPTGMRDPDVDPFIITREGDRWRVWARALDGASRTLDAVVWRAGNTSVRTVTANVIDFTAAAERYGFRSIRARSCFPGNYTCAEWWHFQCEAVLVPWISQFGIELLSLARYNEAQLRANARIWAVRRNIFKRARNGWH